MNCLLPELAGGKGVVGGDQNTDTKEGEEEEEYYDSRAERRKVPRKGRNKNAETGIMSAAQLHEQAKAVLCITVLAHLSHSPRTHLDPPPPAAAVAQDGNGLVPRPQLPACLSASIVPTQLVHCRGATNPRIILAAATHKNDSFQNGRTKQHTWYTTSGGGGGVGQRPHCVRAMTMGAITNAHLRSVFATTPSYSVA